MIDPPLHPAKPEGHSNYLPLRPELLRQVRACLHKLINKHAPAFDGIAVRGLSGQLVVGLMSVVLDKPVAVIRKPGAYTHSQWTEEVGAPIRTYIIIDDLIDTGTTIGTIRKAMRPARCVGIFLYDQQEATSNLDGIPIYGFRFPH